MRKINPFLYTIVLLLIASIGWSQNIGSNDLFRNVSPKNNQFIQINSIFNWTKLNAASNYNLKLYSVSSNNLVNSIFIDSNQTSLTLLNDNYKWKVIALNNGIQLDSTDFSFFSVFNPGVVDSLALWLVGDSGLTTNNGFVTNWTNLKDTADHIIQANQSLQPKVIKDGLNGYDLVDFEASKNILPNVANITSQEYFISILYNFHEPSGRACRLITGPSTGSNWVLGPFLKYNLTSGGAFIGPGEPITQDRFIVHSAHSHGGVLDHLINNNLNGTGALGNIPGLLTLGTNNSAFMNGSIAEIVMVNGSMAVNQADSIEQYLMDKYAPPINLGADKLVCQYPYSLSADNDYVLNYNWSNGSTDSAISLNSSGKYFVTVTDIFNRISVDSIVVSQDSSSYSKQLPNDTNLCKGTIFETEIMGSELFNYSWNTGEFSQNISIDSAGLYVLTITNCLGVITKDSLQVNFFNPKFSLGLDTSICYNNAITLTPDSTFSNVNYLWSNGTIGNQITVNSSGTYFLKVTDSYTCQYIDTIVVHSDSILYGIDLGPDTSLCIGNQIGLLNPIQGIDSYLWSTGSTDSSIGVSSTQKYFLTITNNECQFIDSIDIIVKGQAPQAGFSYLNQCFQDSIIFTDTSISNGGINIQTWFWDFGDGNSSSAQNPVHYYDTNGSFTVQFRIVNDSNCASSVAFPINIYPKPVADFSFNNYCAEDSISFINNSSISSGSITDYNWSFGDHLSLSDTSILQNPKYVYSIDGSYPVELITSSNQGCLDTTLKNILIAPSPQPTFSFVNNYVGDSTRFINNSSISSGIISNYNWAFGNSLTSSLINPKTVYPQLGKYLASLTAISSLGCSKTFSDSIEITLRPPPVPSFNIVFPKYNQYIGKLINFQWNKSDSSNNYYLEVSSNSNFSNIIFQKDKILKRVFMDEFAGGSYYWRVISYLDQMSLDTSNVGLFHVVDVGSTDSLNLWLSADSGVVDTNNLISQWHDLSDSSIVLKQYDPLKKPTLIKNGLNGYDLIGFDNSRSIFEDFVLVSQKNYFVSVLYNFSESSGRACRLLTGPNTGSNWVLGPFLKHHLTAGGPFISNGLPVVKDQFVLNSAYSIGDSLSHIVNNSIMGSGPTGNIPGLLTIGTTGSDFFSGSIAELIIVDGTISEQNKNGIENFVMDKYAPPVNLGINQIVCTFPQALTAYKNSYLSYQWSTGDTDSAIVINSSGRYTVTVTDIFNRITVDSMFFILDTFNYQVQFDYDDTTICFGSSIDLIAGEANLLYTWSTNETTPSITVDSARQYKVSVSNCFGVISEDSVQVRLNNPVFSLGNDTIVCFNTPLQLNADSLFTNVNYLWSNGSTADSLLINSTNNYSLTVTDRLSCSYSDTISLSVDSSLFALSLGVDTSLCRGNYLGLINPIAGINSYLWSNGLNSPTILLDSSSYYGLTVTKDGCQVSDSVQIGILGDIPSVDFLTANYCLNDSVLFSDNSLAPSGDTLKEWAWDFGDGGSSTLSSPSYRFVSINSYDVILTVTTDKGCSDTSKQTVTVYPLPIADFTINNKCSKVAINFNDNSSVSSGQVSGYTWDFGDINNSSNSSSAQNPLHVYDTLGTYNITLISESDRGCRDTVSYSKIVNPLPIVNFSYTGTCLGDTTKFYDQTVLPLGSIDNYLWGINWLPNSSGNVTPRTPNPQQLIPIAKDVKVKLTVETDSGCIATFRDTFYINPKPFAGFTVGDNCVNNDISISNTSFILTDSITYNRFIFRNKDTSYLEIPAFIGDSVGVFPIDLLVRSSNGCSDSISNTVLISPSPVPNFRILNNNTGIPFSVDLQNNSTGSENYIWSFGNGDTMLGESPIYTYRDTGTYSIQLKSISEKGCIDSISKFVNVLPFYLDAALDEIYLSEGTNGFLTVGVKLLNTGNNTIEQIELVADLNSDFQFQEVLTESIYSGQIGSYQFNSSFIQNEADKVNFVCVRIAAVNGIIDGDLTNNYLCEKGFNENLFVSIYPNPTLGKLNMDYVLPKKGQIRINIYDQMGNRVVEEVNSQALSGIYKGQFNTAELRPGIYHYEFVFEGTSRTGTFVKL